MNPNYAPVGTKEKKSTKYPSRIKPVYRNPFPLNDNNNKNNIPGCPYEMQQESKTYNEKPIEKPQRKKKNSSARWAMLKDFKQDKNVVFSSPLLL